MTGVSSFETSVFFRASARISPTRVAHPGDISRRHVQVVVLDWDLIGKDSDTGLPMAMHLEFVVLGPPISNQQRTQTGRSNLTAWRATIDGEVRLRWASSILTGDLKAIIINFYAGNKPSLDVDNMSKPILDVMQRVVYNDDRQIVQAELAHLKISSPFSIVGVSKILVAALQAGTEFVYVRIEDPADPYPLPR